MMNLDVKPEVMGFLDIILITFIFMEEKKRERHRRAHHQGH